METVETVETVGPALLDFEDARRELGKISDSTLGRLIASGELGSVRIGRRRLIPRTEIVSFIARHKAE